MTPSSEELKPVAWQRYVNITDPPKWVEMLAEDREEFERLGYPIRALFAHPAPTAADTPGHSEQLRKSLQSVADELSKRPAELRGPFKVPSKSPAAADTGGLVERLTAERDESDRLTGETLREIEKIRHERDRLIEWRDAKPTGSRDQRERQMLKRTEAAEARAEASAQQLAAAPDMLAMLKDCRERLTAIIDDGLQTDFKAWRDDIDAALKARES